MPKVPARVGKFIVIDGPDYCGKGTQTRRLVSYLLDHPLDRAAKGISVLATREPTGSQYGRRIRELFATLNDPKSRGEEIAQLFLQDRRLHLEKMVIPNLEQNVHVICDRYMYSTIAYQQAQGVDLHYLIDQQKTFLVPDVAIIILPSVAEIVKRKAAERNRPYDEVFEKSHAFIEQVRENYTKMKEWLPQHNIIMIDGDRTPEAIFEDIKKLVDKVVFG